MIEVHNLSEVTRVRPVEFVVKLSERINPRAKQFFFKKTRFQKSCDIVQKISFNLVGTVLGDMPLAKAGPTKFGLARVRNVHSFAFHRQYFGNVICKLHIHFVVVSDSVFRARYTSVKKTVC